MRKRHTSPPLTLLEETYIPKAHHQQKKGLHLQDDSEFIANIYSALQFMPGAVCWKDIHSNFLGCNSFVARLGGIHSARDIIGKNDQQMIWGRNRYAEAFQTDDQKTLLGTTRLNLGRYHYADGKCRTMLIRKFPLMQSDGSIVGTVSALQEIPIASLQNILSAIESYGIHITDPKVLKDIEACYLDEVYKKVQLTSREEEVLYYLVRGATAKIIAKQLAISPRTVEDYIEKLKNKFRCDTKPQVIENVFESGLIHKLLPPNTDEKESK